MLPTITERLVCVVCILTSSPNVKIFDSFELANSTNFSLVNMQRATHGLLLSVFHADFCWVNSIHIFYVVPVNFYYKKSLTISYSFWKHNMRSTSTFFFQRVKDEVQRRKMSCNEVRGDELRFMMPTGHEQFHASLFAAKLVSAFAVQEQEDDLPNSPAATGAQGFLPHCNGQPKLLLNPMYEESIRTAEGKP